MLSSNELVRVLPGAVGGVIQSIYKRYNKCQTEVESLLKAQTEFITNVARGEENNHDTEFWNAITYSHRRHPAQVQFDAIQFHLGIRLGEYKMDDADLQKMYRLKKREFLKRVYLASFGTLPVYAELTGKALQYWEEKYGPLPACDCLRDRDLDGWLYSNGEKLLPGYKDYSEVIKMKWNNPSYQFPEDVEVHEHVLKRLEIVKRVEEEKQAEKQAEKQKAEKQAEKQKEEEELISGPIGFVDGIIYKGFQ